MGWVGGPDRRGWETCCMARHTSPHSMPPAHGLCTLVEGFSLLSLAKNVSNNSCNSSRQRASTADGISPAWRRAGPALPTGDPARTMPRRTGTPRTATHPVRDDQLRLEVLLLVAHLEDAAVDQPATWQLGERPGQQPTVELHLSEQGAVRQAQVAPAGETCPAGAALRCTPMTAPSGGHLQEGSPQGSLAADASTAGLGSRQARVLRHRGPGLKQTARRFPSRAPAPAAEPAHPSSCTPANPTYKNKKLKVLPYLVLL